MNWKAAPLKHRDENRIALYFEKRQELIQQVKQINGARWSQQKKLWHIPTLSKESSLNCNHNT
jgi:integrase/recombinase XerD